MRSTTTSRGLATRASTPEPSQRIAASVLEIRVSRGGIPKLPIPSGEVTPLGLAGDGHAHPQIHGGSRQALLLITLEGIEQLAAQGFAVSPGALGENITTRGLDRRALRIGQRWRIGEADQRRAGRSPVIIEIAKIREPCATLSPLGSGIQSAIYDPRVKDGDVSSPLWGLSGFYAAVIHPGLIAPGDPIRPA